MSFLRRRTNQSASSCSATRSSPLRAFDPDHQRSTGSLRKAVVGPATENPASDAAVGRLADYLEGGFNRARAEDGTLTQFRAKLEALKSAGHLPGFESMAALTSANPPRFSNTRKTWR
jgi:hypothetical protein